MEMHIHDCYELYYSISGGREFLIDDKCYTIAPGDLFLINQYESHKVSKIDSNVHERIIINFTPAYVKSLSSCSTNLDLCFCTHPPSFQHRISLSRENQKRFLFLVDKITSADGYGDDILQQAAILELLVLLNRLSNCNLAENIIPNYIINHQVDEILAYINQNIDQQITTQSLADHFFISPSYLCRIFKQATDTTIKKYITARRIAIAKVLLSEGHSVFEAFEQTGFSDYSNFFKAFTKTVGISPQKYAGFCRSS